MVEKYNDLAPHPAGKRAAPAVKRKVRLDAKGTRQSDCRAHIGSAMYVTRGTRAECSYAVHRMARNVQDWTKTDDQDLEQFMSYMNATSEMEL